MSQRKKNVPRYMDSTFASSSKTSIESKLTGTPKNTPKSLAKNTPKSSQKNTTKCPESVESKRNKSAETLTTSTIKNDIFSSLSTTSLSVNDKSLKYVQHKLDMSYNKYLQGLALNKILTKIQNEAERTIDEQLCTNAEIFENACKDRENSKNLLNEMIVVKEMEIRMQFLEKTLQQCSPFINDANIIKNIEHVNKQLQGICDRLYLKNISFVCNEENYNELQQVLSDIYKHLSDINGDYNSCFLQLADSILKINESVKKLKKTHETVQISQTNLNKLVLQTASLELSKSTDT